jgi:hypothetical protein
LFLVTFARDVLLLAAQPVTPAGQNEIPQPINPEGIDSAFNSLFSSARNHVPAKKSATAAAPCLANQIAALVGGDGIGFSAWRKGSGGCPVREPPVSRLKQWNEAIGAADLKAQLFGRTMSRRLRFRAGVNESPRSGSKFNDTRCFGGTVAATEIQPVT